MNDTRPLPPTVPRTMLIVGGACRSMEETGTPRKEARFWFLSPEVFVFRLASIRRLEAEDRRIPNPKKARAIGEMRRLIRKTILWYVATLIIYSASIALLFATASPNGLFEYVRALFISRIVQAIGFCLIIALTYAAFWLRKNYRMIYALAELAVGVPSLAVAFAGLKDVADVTGLFPLATAVFLLIRGMDNIEEGIKLASGRATDSPVVK